MMIIQKHFQSIVIKHFLYAGLSIIKVSVHADYKGVIAFLSQHLKLLNTADTALWIKDDDLCTRDICKACKSRFSGISGSCSQDHDIIRDLILFRGSR